MTAHTLTIDDATLDKLVNWWKYQYTWNREPIGFKIENASTSPSVKRIDRNGDEFTPSSDFFRNHELFIMPKCLLSPAGVETYGKDMKGTGLDFTGASGNAMVWCNNPQYKYLYESDSDTQYYWYAPYNSNYRGFDYFPTCYQVTGKLHDHFFMAAYEASGFLDTVDGKFKLQSATGKQPITGGVNYPDLPNSGRFTLDDALTYAKNIGSGWSIGNTWSYALLQGLSYIQYGTRDLQTALGRGIVDMPSGEGFAGKLTGADDIDSRLDIEGCGVGSGVNGQTPIRWRNIENLYGNVWEFVAGINMFLGDGTDASGDAYTAGSYRVLKRDGTGTVAAALPKGSYETGIGKVPIVADGYISKIQTEELGALAFIPSENIGSSSTHFCDQFWYPRFNPSIARAGGRWDGGTTAGVNSRRMDYQTSITIRDIGARIEFHPPEVV